MFACFESAQDMRWFCFQAQVMEGRSRFFKRWFTIYSLVFTVLGKAVSKYRHQLHHNATEKVTKVSGPNLNMNLFYKLGCLEFIPQDEQDHYYTKIHF